MQRGQVLGVVLEPFRQRHFQQIAAGMGGEPGLQVRVDPVHQLRPAAAMDGMAVFGGNAVAGDFGLHSVAADQQVERRCFFEAGIGDGKAALLLEARGVQKMQDRQQGGVADQSRLDHLAQPGLAGRAQLPVQGWDAGGEVDQGTFGGGERVAATEFLQSRIR